MFKNIINYFKYKAAEKKLAKEWGIYTSHWGTAEKIAFSICVYPIFYAGSLELISSNAYAQCDCAILSTVWTIYFRREIPGVVYNKELEKRILQRVMDGIPVMIPVSKEEIESVIKNRLQFFSKFFMGEINMAAFVEEAEYLLATDIIKNKPVLFSQNTPLPVLPILQQNQLQFETNEYFKTFVSIMSTLIPTFEESM